MSSIDKKFVLINLFDKSPSEEIIKSIWICVNLYIPIELGNKWIFMINLGLGRLFQFVK